MSVFSFSSLLPRNISYSLNLLAWIPSVFFTSSFSVCICLFCLSDYTTVWLHFQIYPNYRKKKKFGEVQQPGDVGLSPELCYLFSLIPDGLVGLAFNIFIHVLQRQEQRGWIKGLVMVWGEERDGESVRERVSFVSILIENKCGHKTQFGHVLTLDQV